MHSGTFVLEVHRDRCHDAQLYTPTAVRGSHPLLVGDLPTMSRPA